MVYHKARHIEKTVAVTRRSLVQARAQALLDLRFNHLADLVHALGPRPLAELLREIATETDCVDLITAKLEAYAALDPETVAALGADRFAPSPIRLISRNAGGGR